MNRQQALVNLALLAGAIALGVAVWLTWPRQAAPPRTVSRLAPQAITHITIHTRNKLIELALRTDGDNDAGRWRMKIPVSARADTRRVASLLSLAGRVPTHRYEPDSIDTGTTGLDDPALTLRFNDEAPIAIGSEGPSHGTRYVRTAHALLLVDTAQLANSPLGWSHWIAPRLIAPDTKLTKLTLPRLTLTRGETGVWQVVPTRADRGADYAQTTIDAWRHTRALDVEPLDAGRERIARVTLHFADAPPRHLDLITRHPELVLRDAMLGVDYLLTADLAGPLLDMQHPDRLRESRDASLQPSTIPLNPETDKKNVRQ